MIYKITFFKTNITEFDWQAFVYTVFGVCRSFRLNIIIQGNRLDFFISSSKRLDVINRKLYPFYLSDEIASQELRLVLDGESGSGFKMGLCASSLLEMIEKEKVDGRNIVRITTQLSKYKLIRNLACLRVDSIRKNRIIRSKVISLLPFCRFFAFDVSNSITSQISKVKPVLSNSHLNIHPVPSGILELNQCGERQQIGAASFDIHKHSLVVGQSGSGKSFLLKMMIEDVLKQNHGEHGVVLIDPHANLSSLIDARFSQTKVDFSQTKTDLFINTNQPVLSTELTLDLFSTVVDIKHNPNLMRVLKYALNTLFGIQQMNVENLKKILTDSLFRKELLKQVTDVNNLQFFETEYQKLYTSEYATAVLPILNLLSELDFITRLSTSIDLAESLNAQNLVSFPISQTNLGSTVCRIVGGAIIQQVFTLMQAGLVHKKITLIIDEFSVVQTPSLTHILSEARKFGLTVVFAQQYLMQVSKELQNSIFANVVNYFCFKLSRDDAEVIARNLNFEVDEYFLKNKNDPREMLELGTKLLTDLNPREVIARVMVDSQYCSPFKAKTVTAYQ